MSVPANRTTFWVPPSASNMHVSSRTLNIIHEPIMYPAGLFASHVDSLGAILSRPAKIKTIIPIPTGELALE